VIVDATTPERAQLCHAAEVSASALR
jgi:hypothetical protein